MTAREHQDGIKSNLQPIKAVFIIIKCKISLTHKSLLHQPTVLSAGANQEFVSVVRGVVG